MLLEVCLLFMDLCSCIEELALTDVAGVGVEALTTVGLDEDGSEVDTGKLSWRTFAAGKVESPLDDFT